MEKENLQRNRIVGIIVGIIIIFILGIYIVNDTSKKRTFKEIQNIKIENEKVLNFTVGGDYKSYWIKMIVKDDIKGQDVVDIYEEYAGTLAYKEKGYFSLAETSYRFYERTIYGVEYKDCGCKVVSTSTSGYYAHCEEHQKEIEESIRSYDAQKANKNAKKGTTDNSTPSYTLTPTDDEKGFAWGVAKKEVKNRLKAPSTAKFPFSYNDEHIKKATGNKFQVISYVDAENSFGAKLRTNFTVEFEKTGTDGYKIITVTVLE